jgi:hypothetical protein
LFTRILTRDRSGLVVDFQERDFLEVSETPRQVGAAGRDAPATEAGRRGFAPPTEATQDRGAQ